MNNAVKEYQCPGCVCSDGDCYKNDGDGVGCSRHSIGTLMPGLGGVFLGMPIGFNRVGPSGKFHKIRIYSDTASRLKKWGFDKFNVPVWKMLYNGHTLIRGISPRTSMPFTIIVLEDCRDQVDCLEITVEETELDMIPRWARA